MKHLLSFQQLNENLPRQSTVDQLKRLRKLTKGIDIGAKIEIYDLIKSLVKSENIGVILVSSEEEEILSITDTVMIFRNGTSSGIKNKTSELDIANLRLLALQGKN